MGIYASPGGVVTPPVGTVSIVVAGPNLSRLGLYIFNPNAAVTLWVAPTGTAATVNGAGSIAVQPLQGVVLGSPTMSPWTAGLNAVASSGPSNPITVLEFFP